MPLIDFWLSFIVLVIAGAASAVLSIKLVERRNGEIRMREDTYRKRAKVLGRDPDEIWVMGEMWAMVGACEDEAREAAKRYAKGSQ